MYEKQMSKMATMTDEQKITHLAHLSSRIKPIENDMVQSIQPVDVSEQMIEWKLDNYSIIREFSYLPISEQMDMGHKDRVNGTRLLDEHIESVKNKYPKRSLL
jgi:hypothetical protein